MESSDILRSLHRSYDSTTTTTSASATTSATTSATAASPPCHHPNQPTTAIFERSATRQRMGFRRYIQGCRESSESLRYLCHRQHAEEKVVVYVFYFFTAKDVVHVFFFTAKDVVAGDGHTRAKNRKRP